MKRILFLWDADAFGGHDVSALVALEQLAGIPGFQIGALHTGRNSRLRDELVRVSRQTGRLEIMEAQAAACVSESLDGLRRGPRTRSLEIAIASWQPDLALNVQGFITLGLCALAACRALRIPVVSFLPMTHRIWTLQRSPVSLLQDVLNRFWYSIPAAFIVTSDRMKERLVREQRVSAAKVAVVEYGPALPVPPTLPAAEARTRLGFGRDCMLGVIGRVEFRQKNQDFLIRAVACHRRMLDGYRFAIVGDGPDLPVAQGMVRKLGVGDLIQFVPWQQDMSALYAALDALVIPSRFEGVPLVMLEAMARRIPVLAADVDGMGDILPCECLFASGDAAGMLERVRALPAVPTVETLNRLAALVETRINAGVFCDHFVKALQGMVPGGL